MHLHLQLVDGEFTSPANDANFGWLVGLLNFNQYMYIKIFHHTLDSFQRLKWNKQCWLNASRMSWASAGRRWSRFVIIFCDDWGTDYMNISMSLRNLFLVWTSRFLAATMPVYAATPQFLCWPYLWWDICFAMNPVWFSQTSRWKNWSPLLSFFMAVATGSYIDWI